MSSQFPPPSENPFATPVQQSLPTRPFETEGDKTGGLIPYKNPHALIAYYLGIAALLPVVGVPLGIASLILGIIGLRKRRENPIIKGSAHAVIGIVLGACSILCQSGIVVVLIIGAIADSR
ncbi:MAG: hypothetical protein ABL888_01010 [Pirellulaceae bacterium]